MKKILVFLVSVVVCAWSALESASAVPMKIGPVSNYGVLGTSGGKVVSQKTGAQVMLRGVSLDWSDATGIAYYSPIAIDWAAENLGVDVIRFAMAVQYYDETTDQPVNASYAYVFSPDAVENRIDRVVASAIRNDIYVIIDWHSHRALSEKNYASNFFKKMAERYKDVPNIIWEVFNEPVYDNQGSISSYANDIIAGIRQYSSNLALVGTENYSQLQGGCTGVTATNVAYVFHFYAYSHTYDAFHSRIDQCINNGNAVFVSEWGTTKYDGKTNVSTTNSSQWTSYMDQKMISNCNWSYRHVGSGDNARESAIFSGTSTLGSLSDFDNAAFSTSGTFVKNYLTSNRRDWNELYTAGGRSGSCAFAHTAFSIGDGEKSGVASSSCTYQSSNPDVAVIENGVIKAKSAGVTIMTGNDNTKTVVQVQPLTPQSISIREVTCYLDGSCTGGAYGNLSNTGYTNELKVSSLQTTEKSTISIESDNPSVILVKKATCANTALCYGNDRNTTIWMAEIKSLGVANLHVTAPAVKGYDAVDTLIRWEYAKLRVTLKNSSKFQDSTIQYGESIELQPNYVVPITYSLSDESLASLEDGYLKAKDKAGVVWLIAELPETERYQAYKDSVRIVIDHDPSEPIRVMKPMKNVNAHLSGNKLLVWNSGIAEVQVRVFDMLGKQLFMKGVYGNTVVDLGMLSTGHYIVNLKQGSGQKNIRWMKK